MNVKQLLTNTLLVATLLIWGSNFAWGEDLKTYSYDFNTASSGGDISWEREESGITKANGSYDAKLYMPRNCSYDFHERFAFGRTYAGSGSYNDYFLRKKSSGLFIQTPKNGIYFAILNLAVGDKITITTSSPYSFVDPILDGVTDGAAIVSGTEYTVTTAGYQLIYTNYNSNNVIGSVVVKTSTDVVTKPSAVLTSINSITGARTLTVTDGTSGNGNSVTTYYSTSTRLTGANYLTAGTAVTEGTAVVDAAATTLYMVSVSSSGACSQDASFDIASLTQLNVPILSITEFTKNGTNYYPEYTFSSNQSGVFNNPDVTYSYTIAGVDNTVANPTLYSEGKPGQLIVTAHANGYFDASTTVSVLPYKLVKSWDFSKEYTLNSNWQLNKESASMPSGTYSISGKRYVPTSEAKAITNTFGTLFEGLAFSVRDVTSDYYYFVQGLGIGQVGGTSINNATVTVDGLTSDSYTIYKKYNSGNTQTSVVVAGNNTWNLGKMSGTGAHVLHGIFVYSPATAEESGVIGAYDCTTAENGASSSDIVMKSGDAFSFTFKNHGSTSAYKNNFIVNISNGASKVASMYADWYDYTNATGGWDNFFTKPYCADGGVNGNTVNWETFVTDMQEIEVTLNVSYNNGSVSILGIAPKSSRTYYWNYAYGDGALTGNVTINLSVCLSWLEILTIEQTSIGGTIASSGYSSLASAYGLDFANATGIDYAFVVSNITKDAVTLSSVDELPANSGVILKGTAGAAYSIPVKADAAFDGTNKLHAAVTAYDCAANEVYILQGGLFHLVTAASTVPAGKAYLLASDVPNEARSLNFVFGDETGISDASPLMDHGQLILDEFYNLQGQRVQKPTKGLYIVSGKKVIIK